MGSPPLKQYKGTSEAYDGHKMNVFGKLHVDCIKLRNTPGQKMEFLVIDSPKHFGLLGRDNIDNSEVATTCHSLENGAFPLRVIKNFKASIKLKPGAKDQFCAARPVPLPLQEPVKKELKRLETLGIITPCSTGSANASPVVWAKKKNDGLRLCADFKVHVNAKIESETFPLPHQETLFSKLDGAQYFAKLDLKDAY